MELRIVDPRSLRDNPNNPRRTASSPDADAMLKASIAAIGIIQPPIVRPQDDSLVIIAGHRRVRAAIAADLPEVQVLVAEHADAGDDMRSLSENIVRAPMSAVDQWCATEKLIALGWNEEGIATALALPVRTIRKLRLLAGIIPAMLDQMAKGDMPDERQLRVIATADHAEQAQVWKKHKPKKGEATAWYGVAQALEKRRISAKYARFDDELAKAYGVVWFEDLFEQAGEDNRYTTDTEAFFGAQQEWLSNNLPPKGIILTLDQYGRPELPKGAERIYGKPAKNDCTGWYLDPHTGEPGCIAYRMPQPKAAKGKGAAAQEAAPKPRPPLTQKGAAMLGDLRTDALHQALREAPADSDTLLALMVLAFASSNVSVTSASKEAHYSRGGRAEIAAPIVVDGGLTVDNLAVTKAAREMLADVLSCRENASRSGVAATLAGAALDADDRLPNFATVEFLACMSREQIEQAARDNGLPVRAKLKDTRASLVAHFASARFVPPVARFQPTRDELESIEKYRSVATGDDEALVAGSAAEAAGPEDGEGGEVGPDPDDLEDAA